MPRNSWTDGCFEAGDYELDVRIYKSIIDHTIANDCQLISYEAIKNDNPKTDLLIFLEANGIDYLLSYKIWDIVTGKTDRKSTRLNSSHSAKSRMPSSA